MSHRIIAVSPSDLAQVAKLEQQLHTDAWTLATLQDSPNTLAGFGVLGAYDGASLVGYLIYQAFDVSELLRLGVASSHQGRGIGKSLVRAWLDKITTDTALLEVRADNAPALGLYQQMGFETLHVRKGYYRDGAGVVDGVVMAWGK